METHILAVGINQYLDHRISPLKYAQNDATEIFSIFSNFSNPNIISNTSEFQQSYRSTLLVNSEATRHNILTSLSIFSSRAGEDDLFIFYYAGHGNSEAVKDSSISNVNTQFTDDGYVKYLIPYDSNIDSLISTAISFDDLATSINRVKCNKILLIFDCCYSGAANGRTFNLNQAWRDSSPNKISDTHLQRLSGSGKIVFAACSGNEVAIENQNYQHGVFTHFLIEGLKGKAGSFDFNQIDDLEIFLYARNNTINATDKRQNPVRNGQSEGHSIILLDNLNDLRKIHQYNEENITLLSKNILSAFKKFGLQDVVISPNDSIQSLGLEASKLLKSIIRNNHGIAVSCGKTLIETINQIGRLNNIGIEIFPLNGSPDDEVRLTDSMVLTYLLWSKFDSTDTKASIVPTGIPRALFENSKEEIKLIVDKILIKAKSAKIFLFGIGVPKKDNHNIDHLITNTGKPIDYFEDIGAVGEINFQLYDANGNFLINNDDLAEEAKQFIRIYGSKFFALPPKDLKEIARGPAEIVVVAGGREKRIAIKAAILGGFVKILVTDFETALWLSSDN